MRLNAMNNLKLTAILAGLLMLGGCEQTNQLPADSKISVFPTDVQWNIGNRTTCNLVEGPFNDQQVQLSLVDADNLPLIQAPLTVSLDLSESSSNGAAVLGLYDDLNGDGLYQHDELVSDNTRAAYATHTDSRSGVKRLMVRVNLSCPYRGSLYAFAGNTGTLLSVNVINDDTTTTTDPDDTATNSDTDTDTESQT